MIHRIKVTQNSYGSCHRTNHKILDIFFFSRKMYMVFFQNNKGKNQSYQISEKLFSTDGRFPASFTNMPIRAKQNAEQTMNKIPLYRLFIFNASYSSMRRISHASLVRIVISFSVFGSVILIVLFSRTARIFITFKALASYITVSVSRPSSSP